MERDYERVATAIRFIKERAGEQPDLEQIAAAVHLSPGHLHRLFRRWAGITPKQFLQYLTVEHAKGLLAKSTGVLQTSHAVGLSGPGRLHDHFVCLEGLSPGEFGSDGSALTLSYGTAATPFGEALAVITPRGGICHLSFLPRGIEATDALAAWGKWPRARWQRDQARVKELLASLPALESGPLLLQPAGTNFQLKVWRALLTVPPGDVLSYRQLAQRVGQPQAARAVASAVARNDIAWLIPCHRVIRATGETGGYRWGAERKQLMIGWESARRSAGNGAGL